MIYPSQAPKGRPIPQCIGEERAIEKRRASEPVEIAGQRALQSLRSKGDHLNLCNLSSRASSSPELMKRRSASEYLDSEPICGDDADIIYNSLLEEGFFQKSLPPSPHQWLFNASDDQEESPPSETKLQQLIAQSKKALSDLWGWELAGRLLAKIGEENYRRFAIVQAKMNGGHALNANDLLIYERTNRSIDHIKRALLIQEHLKKELTGQCSELNRCCAEEAKR